MQKLIFNEQRVDKHAATSLSRCMSNIEKFKLVHNCIVTEDGFAALADGIKARKKPVKQDFVYIAKIKVFFYILKALAAAFAVHCFT